MSQRGVAEVRNMERGGKQGEGEEGKEGERAKRASDKRGRFNKRETINPVIPDVFLYFREPFFRAYPWNDD